MRWRCLSTEVRHVGGQRVVQGGRFAIRLEQPPPGQHFPQHHANAPEVGAPVDVVAPGLLRSHVAHFALEQAGSRSTLLESRLGDAEVEKLQVTRARQEQVVR
jgi:hypothetical protein